MSSYYNMYIEVKVAKIFPTIVQSGITLTQTQNERSGVSFSISKIGVKYSIDSIRNAQIDFANSLNVSREKLQFIEQIHSDKIEIVREKTIGINGDALITKSKELVLCISVADCVGITIFDPLNEVIAGVHSGWKGTLENIVGKTIQKMTIEFGSKPASLLAYISPSASQKMYEVQEDVCSLFNPQYVCKINSKYFLDVHENVLQQMLECGLNIQNIEQDKSCTVSDRNFHSYRRDGKNFGLNVVYIHQIELIQQFI